MSKTVHDGVNASVDVYVSAHPKKHARIPPEVWGDSKLTDRDVRVFAVLAQFQIRSPHVEIGMRRIGKLINAPYQKVCASIGRLIEFGHILASTKASGKRQSYLLLSPIFKKPLTVDVVDQVSTHLACAKCKITGKKLNKACYCTPCAKTVHPKVFDAVAAKEKRKIERLVSVPRRKAS